MMDNLNIVFWNCNGINHQILELQTFLKTNNIDIVLLGETRINPKSPIQFHNYNVYRHDYPTDPTGLLSGDTAILVKKNIIHHQISIPTTLDSTSILIKLGKNQI